MTLLIVLAFISFPFSHAFATPKMISIQVQTAAERFRGGACRLDALPAALANLPTTVPNLVSASLQSGPYGVVALAAISAAVVLPLTQVRNLYGISVGYGASVAAISYALYQTFSPSASLPQALLASAAFYGLRLALYLLIRDVAGWNPSVTRTKEPPARMERIPFALSLALFYACMTTPLLYALRAPAILGTPLYSMARVGTGMAWTGALLQAIADTHKCVVKQRSRGGGSVNQKVFGGPTKGAFALTRHPNYTGEVLFWVGLFVAGSASFGNSILAWLASATGLFGIYSIMSGATRRLEKRQAEDYGGQKSYEDWKENVPAPLFPFVKWG
jgi:steroid 5-alpha reductase family enzyme